MFDVRQIPQDIIEYYDLYDVIHNGYIYARIKKALYGLKEAGTNAKCVHLKFFAHYYFEFYF